jgi:hypothetical protein
VTDRTLVTADRQKAQSRVQPYARRRSSATRRHSEEVVESTADGKSYTVKRIILGDAPAPLPILQHSASNSSSSSALEIDAGAGQAPHHQPYLVDARPRLLRGRSDSIRTLSEATDNQIHRLHRASSRGASA